MRCIVCNRKIKRTGVIKHKGQEYPICYCANCDLKFFRDIRETPLDYYERLYTDWNVEGVSLRGLVWGHKRCLKLMNQQNKQRKPGGFRNTLRLLDIGCAEGLFVQEACRCGVDAYGIDINSRLVKIAWKRYNGKGRIFSTKLESLDQHAQLPSRYDLITLIDVLEHLHNPREFLGEIKRHLSPKGMVFVSLPNRNVKPRLLPIDGDLPPHHLTWWSRKALEFLFKSAGFKILGYEQEPVNPRDIAVWFDYLMTQKLPVLGGVKSSLQQSGFAMGNETRLRRLYQLKKLELDLLTAGFFLPAWIMTELGYNGTAQCILAQRQ